MAFTDRSAVHAGSWLFIQDEERISYRVEPDGQAVEFVFFGPAEFAVGMSARLVRRCQELFGEAFTEMSRLQLTPGDQDE